MDILETGARLLSEQLGLTVEPAQISSALSQLLGDGQGSIDFAALASKMAANGDLGSVLNSWLGDGDNSPISAQSIAALFGDGQLADFARSIGTDTNTAAAGLADTLPQLVDGASSGGSLLDAVGGAGGLFDVAKSFLK